MKLERRQRTSELIHQCDFVTELNMSYNDFLEGGPDQTPPDLLDSDEEEEPTLVTENIEDMKWGFIKTGYYHHYLVTFSYCDITRKIKGHGGASHPQ